MAQETARPFGITRGVTRTAIDCLNPQVFIEELLGRAPPPDHGCFPQSVFADRCTVRLETGLAMGKARSGKPAAQPTTE